MGFFRPSPNPTTYRLLNPSLYQLNMFIIFEILIVLIILFILVQQNVKLLSYFFFWFIRSNETVIWLFALLFLPGTFIHEAGHLLFAEFLHVRTFDFDIIPQVLPDKTIKLGGVQMEQTDMVRRTIVGLAPVFFGIIVIWLGSYAASLFGHVWYIQLFYFYFLFEVSHTMFSSKKDMEGVFLGIVVIALLLGMVYVIGQIVHIAFLATLGSKMVDFLVKNSMYLQNGFRAALGIAIALYALLWSVLKMGRRI